MVFPDSFALHRAGSPPHSQTSPFAHWQSARSFPHSQVAAQEALAAGALGAKLDNGHGPLTALIAVAPFPGGLGHRWEHRFSIVLAAFLGHFADHMAVLKL